MKSDVLSSQALLEVLVSLIRDELKTLRHTDAGELQSDAWHADTPLGHAESESTEGDGPAINADSMELLCLTTAVSNFFCLYESGLDDYLLRRRTLGGWVEVIQRIRAEDTRDLTFQTSGSTGEPKPCRHAWRTLLEECDYFAAFFDRLQEGGIRRVLCPALPHHIYGFLFGVLLPERTGVPSLRGQKALAAVQGRRLEAGDLIVGYPFIWQLFSRQGAPFPPGVAGLTSTGPSDARVIETLKAQGLSHMVEIHGASETGGIGVRCSTQAPYTLLPRWRRGPQAHQIIAAGEHTPRPVTDHLEWEGGRRYWPVGRLDRAVQVGGVNVYPQQVTTFLHDHPKVAKALVRPMTRDEGERLKAFIVPFEAVDTEGLADELTRWCRAQLSTPSVPGAFTFGTALPTGDQGKASDWPLEGARAGGDDSDLRPAAIRTRY